MSVPGDILPIPEATLRALRRPGASQAKALALWLPSYQEGRPVQAGKHFENAVKFGWRRNELIYACIQRTAYAATTPRLRLLNPRTEEPLDSHPLLDLIHQPNPEMGEEGFHAARKVYQKLSGHSYWEVINSRAGLPVQLWPLRPDWVRPVLTRQGLTGWEVGPRGAEPQRLRAEQVIDFPVFDPLSLYGGTSPAVVAGYAVDTDNAVSQFAKDFFERGALPAGVLTTTQKLLEEDINRIRAGWAERYGGSTNWLKAPAVLDSDASYARISMSFEEMGFEALDSRNEARICMVMGVPPILLGTNTGMERSTLTNYPEARRSWWEDTLKPDLGFDLGRLRRHLLPRWGDRAMPRLEWDWSEVPALREDENEVRDRARRDFARGGITLNEYRAELALDPLPDGDVFYLPKGITIVASPTEAMALQEQAQAAAAAPPAPAEMPAEEMPGEMPMTEEAAP